MSNHRPLEWSRKRSRTEAFESNSIADSQLEYTEHRDKRTAEQLPQFRQWSMLFRSRENNNSDSNPETVDVNQASAIPHMELDQDADMTIDHVGSTESFQLNETISNITGRIPTPIHCTFAAQVLGNNWGVMPSTDKVGNTSTFLNGDAVDSSRLYQDPSVPRSVCGNTEWSLVQNRRLPSPISENGGEETPVSPGMVLDNSPHLSNAQAMPLHPNIRLSPQPADVDAAMIDTDAGSPSSAPATPSPRSKYGHSRSKHTINTWTLQPGMKKSFSIGYRADCEKCRMKIPGHFNHIIIS
ncbi:hypothetical protein GGS21DRAFT_383198 [Xylaria nigripes]|nr:hypothetical protein GGS21DRAFT_383198 [Xylaria nigripes]